MKNLLLLALSLISSAIFAQKPCEYTTNVTDSLGTYKTTKEYIIAEKNFAGTFIGDISEFKFYVCDLDWVDINNGFNIDKSRYTS